MFLGGSNLGIPTNSEHQDLALDLLKIMVSPEYQRQFAAAGHDPGAQVRARQRHAAAMPPSPRPTAAQNSRFVPTSEKWAGVEAANVLPDMLVDIAQGGDIASAAADGRRCHRGPAQRLDSRFRQPPDSPHPNGLSRWPLL